MNHPTLTFYGGAGTVTGSKYLIRVNGEEVLMDCGLFQGLKELRLRNWQKPPFDPEKLSAVILSHAHLDHSGYLPVLYKNKYHHKTHCTHGTAELIRILLKDSAKIQEEDARYANKKGFSKHKPALPLYTSQDVLRTLKHVTRHPFKKMFKLSHEIEARFHYAGHILGASIVELHVGKKDPVKLVFSGDFGRWNQPVIRDPEFIDEADVLLIESTYGNREHPDNAVDEFVRVIHESVDRGGVLVIPSFAVGRTQDLLWLLRKLESENKIPRVPVFLDSPMAIDVTDVYCARREDHDLEMETLRNKESCPLKTSKFQLVQTAQASRRLNQMQGPMIIISASGMATGGRVLHHLENRLGHEKNTILLVGFQAAGTRGRSLKEGATKLRFFGHEVTVKAKIESIDGLSAHGDKNDLMRWLREFKKPPKQTYVVHGEPESSKEFAETIRQELQWKVDVTEYGQTVELLK